MPTDVADIALQIAEKARRVSRLLADASTEQKDRALRAMAELLAAHKADILAANKADLDAARDNGLAQNLIDRLRFGAAKIDGRRQSLEKIAALPDPVGQTIRSEVRPGGLHVARVRVPLGVILMVFEARPHVTVNAGAFCLKSGNAAILRGGSEARQCNTLLGRLWGEALERADLPSECVQVTTGSHDEVRRLLELDQHIDLVIPRGGKRLIETVAEHSRIPVIKHFEGICHVYLDEGFDAEVATRIAVDSKCLMPHVCNAAETLLLSEASLAEAPAVLRRLQQERVTLRGCPRTQELIEGIEPAGEDDWRTEYLDMIMSVRVVSGVKEAIEHINRYGSHHTDTIVTGNEQHAEQFTKQVDSGVVLVNASTMFCDGESLGMGAEIGISTDKIHARGPMGLEELTSYKFVLRGDGLTMGEW